MSRKECSPDNAACEDFFGRLKNKWFYSHDWLVTPIEEFVAALDAYIRWYNEARLRSRWVRAARSSTAESWESPHNPSKFSAAPPYPSSLQSAGAHLGFRTPRWSIPDLSPVNYERKLLTTETAEI